MQAIIDGETYDTRDPDTRRVASRDCHESDVSFLRYWEEDLYRTGDGRWFLRGVGGPLTRWSKGGTLPYVELIEPMTPDQASDWLREAGQVDAWRQHFDPRQT